MWVFWQHYLGSFDLTFFRVTCDPASFKILLTVGRLAKATFIAFFVYLCSTNVELVTKPNLDNNKQIYLNHQLLLTCVVLSLGYYVSYRTTYSGDHAD